MFDFAGFEQFATLVPPMPMPVPAPAKAVESAQVIGRVPTRFCVGCGCEFVPRPPSHDRCRDCAIKAWKARQIVKAARAAAPAPVAKPPTQDQLRAELIEQYKKGELPDGVTATPMGSYVILKGEIGGRKFSFNFFESKIVKTRVKSDAPKPKSPDQLRREALTAAKLAAENLRKSADAATEEAKRLTAVETTAKIRLEAEPDSEEALDAFCEAEDSAGRAWNSAAGLESTARAAEQKLAQLLAPPPVESKPKNGNGKNGKGNGKNGKGKHNGNGKNGNGRK